MPDDLSQPLYMGALDAEDLSVLSAHMQDALIGVTDMTYLQREKRFALVGRRYDWTRTDPNGCERRAVGLHFDCVLAVSRSGFAQTDGERVLNLLAVEFAPGAAPSGTIMLIFSGNAAVRLDVECIEAQMRDLGPRWPCTCRPAHPIDADA